MKQLLQTLEAFNRKKYTEKLKERKFDLEVVAKHLVKAAQDKESTLEPAAKKLQIMKKLSGGY